MYPKVRARFLSSMVGLLVVAALSCDSAESEARSEAELMDMIGKVAIQHKRIEKYALEVPGLLRERGYSGLIPSSMTVADRAFFVNRFELELVLSRKALQMLEELQEWFAAYSGQNQERVQSMAKYGKTLLAHEKDSIRARELLLDAFKKNDDAGAAAACKRLMLNALDRAKALRTFREHFKPR